MAVLSSTARSIFLGLRRPGIFVLTVLSASVILLSDTQAREARPERVSAAAAPRDAGEPIMGIVSIKSQQITFYDADGWILRAPVSTGMRGRETPAGIFAIVEKKADHRSNLYDDAHMPHMQRLTWNGIAIHGGPLPGYPASKGCVRLPFAFARTLFDKTQMGMRVIVSPDDADPVEISHAALLVPDAETVAAAPERAERLTREAEEAVKAAAEAKKVAKAAAREAATLKASLRKLERSAAAADADLVKAEKALDRSKTDEEREKVKERWRKADEKASEALERLERARDEAKAVIEAEAAARDAAEAAARRVSETAKAAKDAKLALEPVSVYISRATEMMYVRRNTRKPWPDGGQVYDFSIEAPVTIRDPDRPIGTHIFTAMAENGTGLRWSAVTIDSADEATSALDRITIPQDVLDRIAPGTLPRSSIVVSDEPLSKETNYRTEFVTVLSNQPQGGFKTRRPTVTPPVLVPAPVASRPPSWNTGGFFGFSYLDEPRPQRKPNKKQQRDRKKPVQQGWW